MPLDQVIQFVNEELEKLYFEQQQKKIKEKCKILLSILEKIRSLLQESNQGLHRNKIEAALSYLQNVHIAENKSSVFALFSRPIIRTTGEILKEHHPVLSDEKIQHGSNDFETALSIDEHIILGSIHIALMECYTRVKWDYVFPDETTDEIKDVLQQWQAKRIMLLNSPYAAHVDFARDVCIAGESGGATDEIKSRIDTLVDGAYHYKPEHKQLLNAWLNRNGGQDNARFLTQFFEKGFFVAPKESNASASIGIAKNVTKHNWYIEDGKIYFSFDTLIRTVQYGSMAIIITTAGETKILKDMDEIGSALEENKMPPALMRIAGKIKLEVIYDSVMPKVEAFTVHSYTNFLKRPLEKLDNENLLAVEPFEYLSLVQ